MSTQPILTDADLEAMLARRAGPGAPLGLAQAIEASVARAPEALRRQWSVLAPPPARTPALRFAWIVVAVGLLLAATASAVLVGSELFRRANQLTVVPPPTAVPVPTAGPMPSGAPVTLVRRPIGSVNSVAFAGDGSLWLATAGGVVRWDPASGSASLYDQNAGLPTTEAIRVVVGRDGATWATGAGWVARLDGTWTVWSESGDLAGLGVSGDLGGLAVGSDGTAWVVAGTSTGRPVLLRYEGSWTAIDVPEAIGGGAFPWAGRLDVAPDGSVWAGAWTGAARYDGSSWTAWQKGSADLPRIPSLAGVAPDGSAWVELQADGCVATGPETATCSTPAAGVARYDGTSWTVFGPPAGGRTDSNMADPAAQILVGSDGTVWAWYESVPRTTSDPPPGLVSRLGPDGKSWITVEVPELAGARPLGAAPDGALWLQGADGFLRYDGASVTRHAAPTVEAKPTLPPLALVAQPGETVTTSALGTITWRTYDGDPSHFLWSLFGTPHGPVVVDGPDLRWLAPSGEWEGSSGLAFPFAFALDGEDLLAYGRGIVRFTWNDGRWVPGDPIDLPPAFGFVYSVAAGPRGVVAAGATGIAWSTDGRHFVMAEVDPAAADPAAQATPPGPTPVGGGVQIGPLMATRDGFVALLVAGAAPERGPYYEPVPWFSADGSTWEPATVRSPFGTWSYVRQVSARDGRFVAIGNVGGERGPWAVWVSDDGLAWDLLPTLERAEPCGDACADNLLAGVSASADGWIIVSWDGAAWVSADGRTWEPLRGWPGVHGGYIEPFVALSPGVIVASGSLPGPWHDAVVVGTIEP